MVEWKRDEHLTSYSKEQYHGTRKFNRWMQSQKEIGDCIYVKCLVHGHDFQSNVCTEAEGFRLLHNPEV